MWPQFNDKMSWWKQNCFNVNTQPSGLQSAIPLNTAVNANQKEKNDDMAKLIKRLTFMWHIENMHSYKNTKASFQSSHLFNRDTWGSRIELFSIRLKNAFLWHFYSLLLLLFFLCKFHIFRTFFFPIFIWKGSRKDLFSICGHSLENTFLNETPKSVQLQNVGCTSEQTNQNEWTSRKTYWFGQYWSCE